MKRILTITALAVSLILGFSFRQTASAQPGVGVSISYQDFYDELSPHGRWMDYPEYGYVWMPNAGADFQPYSSNGRWVWSDEYDWMWVSDYSWGWAPFHYGRWMQDPMYGWMWVPGYEWSPAWVAWRDGGDYYGWAPLRPGFNISIGFGGYNPPIDYWCFAPRRYISSPRIYNYCLPRRQNVTIINNTTIINNYNRRTNVFVNNGPRRGDAERYAGRINPVRFRESNTPGRSRVRRNEVTVYRPSIQRDNNRTATPRQFDRYNNSNGNRTDISRNNDRNDRNANNLPDRRIQNRELDNRNDNRQPDRDTRVNDRRINPGTTDRTTPADRSTERPNMFERRNAERPDNNPNRNNHRIEPRRDVSTTPDTRREERRTMTERRNENSNPQPRREMRTEMPQRSQPQMREQRQQQPQRMESRPNNSGNRGFEQQRNSRSRDDNNRGGRPRQ